MCAENRMTVIGRTWSNNLDEIDDIILGFTGSTGKCLIYDGEIAFVIILVNIIIVNVIYDKFSG